MSLTDGVKPTDITINTDLYQLTMAQAYWQNGLMDMRSNYNLFYRDKPFKGGYAVCCGTEQIQDLVNNFVFEDEDIEYLSSLKDLNGGQLFDDGFLEYLRNFKLDLDIWAMREGEVVFPNEPIVRIQGNAISCQIIETALLNLINFQTLVATKASRVVHAAKGRIVSDFGLRRAQGPDGGLMVARASYVGGVDSTSNVLAGKIYGIPVYGTHAHSWVMSFPEEIEAFRAFLETAHFSSIPITFSKVSKTQLWLRRRWRLKGSAWHRSALILVTWLSSLVWLANALMKRGSTTLRSQSPMTWMNTLLNHCFCKVRQSMHSVLALSLQLAILNLP